MPLDTSIKKVLVIGSGPIVIGQAAEFDYAGAQACRVLKEAGVNVVLCNSNPATIMTDQAMADEIYLEPLTTETIKRIIKKERPDSILAGLGGQTGLTLAMQLDKEGFLAQQGVRLLGTDAKTISPAVLGELEEENKLVMDYQKLQGSAQIEFQGKVCNLSQLAVYKEDPQREVRKGAYTAEGNFYREHKAEYDRIYDELVKLPETGKATMVGYLLKNTASLHGTVSRGVCAVEDGKLRSVREALKIQLYPDGTLRDLAEDTDLSPETVVSMNFWGFAPSIFPALREYFENFLRTEAGENIKAECLLPVMVGDQLQKGALEVSVLHSADKWFGMTYHEDREIVAEELRKLHARGDYPESLRM